MEENRLAPPIQVMMEAIVPKELSMTKSAKGAGFGEVTRLQRLFGSLEIWTISNHAMFHQRDDVPYHRYWTLCYIHGKSNSWIRIPWRDCIRCSYHLLWWEESSCPRLQVQRWWSYEVDQWTWPWFGNREVPLEIFSTQECRKDPQGRQRDDGVPWPISVSLSIWGCNPTC